MENNNEKKLYTLLVYSENIAGILNQITAVFTRRQVNICLLYTSITRLLNKNVHREWRDSFEEYRQQEHWLRFLCHQ